MANIDEGTSHSAWHIPSAQEMFYSEYGIHCTKGEIRQKTNSSSEKAGLTLSITETRRHEGN